MRKDSLEQDNGFYQWIFYLRQVRFKKSHSSCTALLNLHRNQINARDERGDLFHHLQAFDSMVYLWLVGSKTEWWLHWKCSWVGEIISKKQSSSNKEGIWEFVSSHWDQVCCKEVDLDLSFKVYTFDLSRCVNSFTDILKVVFSPQTSVELFISFNTMLFRTWATGCWALEFSSVVLNDGQVSHSLCRGTIDNSLQSPLPETVTSQFILLLVLSVFLYCYLLKEIISKERA